MIEKSTPYGKRQGYRQPTEAEMKSGKTLYLKIRGSYGGHRYINGVITENGKATTLLPEPHYYVIKAG